MHRVHGDVFLFMVISMIRDRSKPLNPKVILLNLQKISVQSNTHEICFEFTHRNSILVNLTYRNRMRKYRSYFCVIYIHQKLKCKIKAEMEKKPHRIILYIFFHLVASGEHLTFRHLYSEIYFSLKCLSGGLSGSAWCGDSIACSLVLFNSFLFFSLNNKNFKRQDNVTSTRGTVGRWQQPWRPNVLAEENAIARLAQYHCVLAPKKKSTFLL